MFVSNRIRQLLGPTREVRGWDDCPCNTTLTSLVRTQGLRYRLSNQASIKILARVDQTRCSVKEERTWKRTNHNPTMQIPCRNLPKRSPVNRQNGEYHEDDHERASEEHLEVGLPREGSFRRLFKKCPRSGCHVVLLFLNR
jgi:hypothetical protein